ncbi:hypothetical protein [Salipiger sp. PrR003]|uniref:hypothetical protein n=1 Tax=Salipiger sp. PrR003 TaxID=2706776 RepID=UPI0013DAA5D0|nr:hypothetical protein [Salipiger sp. PrR003]NDV50641.1 hypothetical protein [Salipiger sp. PrR003]
MSHPPETNLAHTTNWVSRFVPARSVPNVALATLSELGELAEEVNIQTGYCPKEPDVDGVVGEVADVLICLGDLVWTTFPDEEDRTYVEMRGFDLSGFSDINPATWLEAEQAVSRAAKLVSDLAIQSHSGGHDDTWEVIAGFSSTLADVVKDLLATARSGDPSITLERFQEILTTKTAKWASKFKDTRPGPSV